MGRTKSCVIEAAAARTAVESGYNPRGVGPVLDPGFGFRFGTLFPPLPRAARVDDDSGESCVVGGRSSSTLHGAAVAGRVAKKVAPRATRRVGGKVKQKSAKKRPLSDKSLAQFFKHFRLAATAEKDVDAAHALVRLAVLADGNAWGESKGANGNPQKYSGYCRDLMKHCGFTTCAEVCALSEKDVSAAIEAVVVGSDAKCAYNKNHGVAQLGLEMPHKIWQNYYSGWGAVCATFAKHRAWLSAVEALRLAIRADEKAQGPGGRVLTIRVEGSRRVSVDMAKLPPDADPVPVRLTAAEAAQAAAEAAAAAEAGEDWRISFLAADPADAEPVAAAAPSAAPSAAAAGGPPSPPRLGDVQEETRVDAATATADPSSDLDSLLGSAGIATTALSDSEPEAEESRFVHVTRKVPRGF